MDLFILNFVVKLNYSYLDNFFFKSISKYLIYLHFFFQVIINVKMFFILKLNLFKIFNLILIVNIILNAQIFSIINFVLLTLL